MNLSATAKKAAADAEVVDAPRAAGPRDEGRPGHVSEHHDRIDVRDVRRHHQGGSAESCALLQPGFAAGRAQ
jgi:hypothetical protein